MEGGFSFCGTDIAKLSLEYAPEKSNMYVYNPATKQVQEQTMEAHDGGYFFGVSTGPKDFVLRCYYEGHRILDGHFTTIHECFRVGRTGQLVFEKRPWCWYTATVVSVDTSQQCNYENGLITIKLRAYYPYARSDDACVDSESPYLSDIMNNSGMLTDSTQMPSTTLNVPITSEQSFLLYNPGTERAKVAIEIAGDVGDGVTIANATTNQLCKFVGISQATTTDEDKWVVSDAMNGKTVLTDGTNSSLAFLYHDNGFLELEPSGTILRNVSVHYAANSTIVTLRNPPLPKDVLGCYIYINNAWRRIVAIRSENQIDVMPRPTASGDEDANIVTMNAITVKPISTMELTKLNFIYKPTFS